MTWWKSERKVNRAEGPYNLIKGDRQRTRISEGCPWNCQFCYEPTDLRWFGVPTIERNIVEIMDMNFLCQPEAIEAIKWFGEQRVNGKVVYYEFISGIDYRFLTSEIAKALKKARFGNIHIAWDWYMKDQYKIKGAIDCLIKTRYKPNQLTAYMICNWKIPYQECCRKLDLLKVWNVNVADCYYDNQVWPNVKPDYWTKEQLKDFKNTRCRKHNQLVKFGIDPEVKIKR